MLTTEHKNLGSNPTINDRVLTNTYPSLEVLMGPYAFLCILLGPNGSLYCRSLFVLMDSNGSLWVLICPLRPYGSLYVLIGPYAFFCVYMGPYASL